MGVLAINSCNNTDTNPNSISNETNISSTNKETQDARIIPLSGTVTEVLSELGLSKKIVATDITSNYPDAIVQLPKVGHNKNISTEGVLSQNPTHVIALKESCNEGVMDQIQSTGVYTEAIPFEYSLDGMINLTSNLASLFNIDYNTDSLRTLVQSQLDAVIPFDEKPKILFIYARGLGTLNVAGKGTKVQKMITLSGAENIDLDFENFKPLTAESLIETNPDVILLFSSGFESLEGGKQLLEVPGVAQTKAGQTGAFITMDGALLSSFSPRMGKAVLELNKKIHDAISHNTIVVE